ncbi:MAG: glycosyltransferase [Clostridium sp.]|uniref:glycosyltransferase n=1 Tax=Clostridium sp. TaxID=1506 RepID=UPI003EE504A0
MKRYKATIIVPTYNRCELLRKTLRSIEKQKYNLEEIEIIIVDDGSTDETRKMISEEWNRKNIKYFFQEDLGFRVSRARNIGAINASGEICIFIDCGQILTENFLENHIEAHKKKNIIVIGYVYGFSQFNENNKIMIENIDLENMEESLKKIKELNIKDMREFLYEKHGEEIYKWKSPWIVFWGTNFSVSRDFLLKGELFDEKFESWGGEDIEFGINLLERGGEFHLNREAATIDYPHEKLNKFQENFQQAFIEMRRKHRYIHNKYDRIDTFLSIYVDLFSVNTIMEEIERRGGI